MRGERGGRVRERGGREGGGKGEGERGRERENSFIQSF